MTQPTMAVIYCRSATTSLQDVQQNNNIRAQEKICRNYADEHALEIAVFYYDDGVSGMSTQRPGWQSMMHYLQRANTLHTVLVSDIARLARDICLCDAMQYECTRLGHRVTIIADIKNIGNLRRHFETSGGTSLYRMNTRGDYAV